MPYPGYRKSNSIQKFYRVWNMCNGIAEMWNASGFYHMSYLPVYNPFTKLDTDGDHSFFAFLTIIVILCVWPFSLSILMFLRKFYKYPAIQEPISIIFDEYLV